MKKILFFGVLTCSLMTISGCYQKTIAPPVHQPDYSQTAPAGYQQPGETPKTSQPPRYLDIQDSQSITLEDVAQEEVIPAMDYINDRIFEYSRKLDRWKELDNQSLVLNISQDDTAQMVRCFRDLQKVLKGYSTIREDVLKYSRTQGYEGSRVTLGDLQKKDIAFLESPCGRLLASGEDQAAGWEQREEGADLAQLEALIARYAGSQEYEEVVQTWLQIPRSQIDRVNLPAKILYANSLMYLHQEEAAAEIYQQIVDQMSSSKEQSTDLISLRKMLADLYTASGNYPSAEEQYNKISGDYQLLGKIEEWSQLQLSILDRSLKGSPELKAYSGLLRNYLGFIPEKDGYKIVWQADEFLRDYPYSAVSSNVDIIKSTALSRADAWLNGLLTEADRLGAEKNYREAIDLLATIPDDITGEQRQAELKGKSDEFVLAEAVARETQKLEVVQELQRKWNNGMLLIKGERFDEAIDQFTELIDTEYSVKAEEKINEVSLLAARADRRKAADLFIRYTKTADLESKKKLLLESRRLLKDILVKYPDVEITEKVKANIQRVEQEMNVIDPNLMSIADNGNMYVEQEPVDAFDIQTGAQAQQGLPEQSPPIIEQPLE